MKAIVQRVSEAHVSVGEEVRGKIGVGFLVYVGIHREDTESDCERMADRLTGLRIFNDSDGKINLALLDLPEELAASILLISNFTLYGDTAKNRRPSFTDSAGYERGKELFENLQVRLTSRGVRVFPGTFGADMQVSSTNDGPVNVLIETRPSGPGRD